MTATIKHKFLKETYELTFNFRKAPADKVTKVPGAEYTDTTEGGKAFTKRKDCKITYKPVPDEIEIASEAIDAFLLELVYSNLRPQVDDGSKLHANDINIAALLTEYVSGGADVRKFPKEFRATCAALFEKFLLAIGKKPAGAEVQKTLLAGGFNTNAANKYLEGLPQIKQNLLDFITADTTTDADKETYAEYIKAMVDKIDTILNPNEQIDIAALGL